ncbi:hypothetical protein WICPIJ_002785, partial [Wickerhamomyces pijperi]
PSISALLTPSILTLFGLRFFFLLALFPDSSSACAFNLLRSSSNRNSSLTPVQTRSFRADSSSVRMKKSNSESLRSPKSSGSSGISAKISDVFGNL